MDEKLKEGGQSLSMMDMIESLNNDPERTM